MSESKQLTINGEVIPDATEFAWDGCHKVYLIRSAEERAELGWPVEDIYPISDLPAKWEASCSLRFISSADLSKSYVAQLFDEDTPPAVVRYE